MEQVAIAGSLLERESELATLERAVAQGSGQVVAVVGPAGIGKSRLLEAAVAAARRRGVECLVARGAVHEQDYPFTVTLQLFEKRARAASVAERRRLFAEAAGLAAPLLAPRHTHALEQPGQRQLFALIHGLYWFVVNLSERSPLVLVVDDAHAADGPSLRFLLYLAERLEGLPIALLIGVRSGEPGTSPEALELIEDARTLLLRPGPLSPDSVGQLIEEQLGFAGGEAFVNASTEVTGGNPFLVRELLAALAAEGIDERSATAERARSLSSAAVSQRLLVRLARLPTPADALARALAVLGDGAPVRVLASMVEVDPGTAIEAIDALTRVQITRQLSDDQLVSFVHPLVRSALYEDLPRAELARMRARAAEVLLDAGAPHEQVVSHIMAAPRGTQPRGVELLTEVAADAMRRGVPSAAATFLQRALEEQVDEDARDRLLLDLARARFAAGEASAAEEAARSAAALSPDPTTRAQARLLQGRALYAQARHGDAAKAFEAGLDEVAEDPDTDLAHELRAAFATAASMDANLAKRGVAMVAVIAQEDPPSPTFSERALLAQLAANRAWGAAPRHEVRTLAERAWGDGKLLEAETVEGTMWTLVTAALAWSCYFERNVEVCDTVLKAAQRQGSVLAFATASYCRMWPQLQLGRVDAAIADGEAALAARRHGWEQHRGSAMAILAHALLEKGDLVAARDALVAIDEPDMSSRIDYALLLDVRARLSLLRGDPGPALRDASEAGRLLQDVYGMRASFMAWRATAAMGAAALGERERALALLRDDREVAEGIGAPMLIARGLRTRGLIEGGRRGLDLLAQAVRVLEPIAPCLEHVHALIDYGAALRRADQRRAAREPLERGFSLAEQGGATALAQRALVELAALGARPRKDPAARDRLTPSERRVAEMAASGMTNKQIAQALFVTLKTVEAHLHASYEKLGVRSRSELGAALRHFEVAASATN